MELQGRQARNSRLLCHLVRSVQSHSPHSRRDVYKVDVDKNQELSALFNIRSIPSLLFIPKTGKPTMSVGAHAKNELEQMIKETLLKQ